MVNTLIENDGNDYSGKYVATSSFNSKKVIASGEDASIVRRSAIGKGHDSPVVFFVPWKGVSYNFGSLF